MACNDIVSAILHYKRNIDKISDPPERALKYEDRLLHCINKLYKLPINVNHLQETGVGRTVNSLRKIEGEKGLGDAAKALVAKWKTMVMLEDEAERKQKEELKVLSQEDLSRLKIIREAEKSEFKKTDNDGLKLHKNQSRENKQTKTNNEHLHNGLLDISKSKKRKHDSDGDHRHHSEKEANIKNLESNLEFKNKKSKSENNSNCSRSNNSSNNSETINHLHKSKHKLINSQENSDIKDKKKHKSNESLTRDTTFEKPSSDHQKYSKKDCEKYSSKNKKKLKTSLENDGIDSQSGASFADALGPMLLKKSSKKRSSQNPVVPSQVISDHSSDNNVLNIKKDKKEVDMLFQRPSLEPLEPDLIDTLPTPTPYYKPHPSYIPTQEAVKKRVQAEEDALATIMSNKNTRTKVYSGVKGGLSYVPTLYECCCRVLQQHIDALEYTGGIPFSLLKPVLEGATPSQLYQFEHFNPYIIEDTNDLWKFHVNKEFRNQKRQEFESWRDMYLRCVDEREEKYKAVTANIIQRTIENSVPVRKAKLAYIDVAKPPRNILKKQIKNGTSKPESSRLLGKNDPEAVKVPPPKQPTVKEPCSFKIKPKVAPLMQKTLKSIKMSRFKR